MTRGISDTSVVYISICSNLQLMRVINNNNNIPIYMRFHVSWYTKQWPAMMSTYTDKAEPISTWWVEGTYVYL